MAALFLLIGTNLGDRKANIECALAELDSALGTHEKISQVIETQALGFDGEPFLNCVVRYESRRRPETILRICKEIEYRMGRRELIEFAADGSRIFHNRIIDIDILLYGKRRVCSPTLVIPHPQVEERPFVKPLLEQVL